MATIGLTGCNKGETYNAIPTEKLNIVTSGESVTLKGLKDKTEDLSKYDSLVVPKNVTSVCDFDYDTQDHSKTKAYESIKTVVFEDNSVCTGLGATCFSNLPNFEKIIFPAKLNTIPWGSIIDCAKLSVFDISKVENLDCFLDNRGFDGFAAQGKIIINSTQQTKAQEIKAAYDCFTNWTIEVK